LAAKKFWPPARARRKGGVGGPEAEQSSLRGKNSARRASVSFKKGSRIFKQRAPIRKSQILAARNAPLGHQIVRIFGLKTELSVFGGKRKFFHTDFEKKLREFLFCFDLIYFGISCSVILVLSPIVWLKSYIQVIARFNLDILQKYCFLFSFV